MTTTTGCVVTSATPYDVLTDMYFIDQDDKYFYFEEMGGNLFEEFAVPITDQLLKKLPEGKMYKGDIATLQIVETQTINNSTSTVICRIIKLYPCRF